MERLYLHIGLMKTGSTYLQQVWRANATELAEQGVWFPSGPEEPRVRLAVWDLVGRRPRGASDARVVGQWEALTDAAAARADQRVLISEEYLAARTLRQAKRAVAGFDRHEVHVVVTVRDLGRVLASSWQEDVKSGRTHRWPDFIAAVSDPAEATRDPARGFWMRQDLPRVLEVWSAAAGQDRVHVVTVPQSGAPRGLLLERMGSLVGFDPATLTNPAERTNQSLDAPTIEVIRRLNERLDGRLNQRQYDWVVKRTMETRMPPASSADRLLLPPEHHAWARREAERMVGFVREGGFHVVGDLDELVPEAADAGRVPGRASDSELLDSSLEALAVLAEQAGNAWWFKRRRDQPRVPPSSPLVRAASAVRGAAFRLRQRGADLADRNRVAAAAMGLYLRLTRIGRRG